MAANRTYRHLIVWAIAVLAVFFAIGLAAIVGWEPLKRSVGDWTLGAATTQSSAAAAYEQGNWKRAAELSRPSVKTKADDPNLLRLYARASARLERDRMATVVYDRIATAQFRTRRFLSARPSLREGRQSGQGLRDLDEGDSDRTGSPRDARSPGAAVDANATARRGRRSGSRLPRQPGWEARALLMSGEIEQLLKNPKGAVDALRRGLELDPSTTGLYAGPVHFRKLLARSWLEIGEPKRAIEVLLAEPAQPALVPSDPEANWLLSRAYLQNGQNVDASAALKRSGNYRDDNPLMPEASPYTGAARCASCHPREAKTHDRSRHARTIHRGRASTRFATAREAVTRSRQPQGVSHVQA